jgi:hypothetical protein
MNELHLNLLKVIHEYYPVGIRTANGQYPGYQRLRRVLENKINSTILREENQWTNLVAKVAAIVEVQVFDQAYEQFPNYVLRINIKTSSMGRYVCNGDVYLVISLLTNFYTVFYQEDVIISEVSDKRITLVCISEKDSPSEVVKIIDRLKVLVSELFPSHAHIHHKIVFNLRIEGATPHGEDAETIGNRPVPTFCFLFGLYPFIDITEVLD